ncbi:MAG: alpha-glycosidase [Clostridia bacterium]|nr:alpha-glycosidase [Clostridia bacterium]
MIKEAIYHKSDSTYAYPLDRQTLVLRIRTKRDDIDSVILYYGNRYDPNEIINIYDVEMTKKYSDELFDYYETIITPDYNRICYYFKLIKGEEEIILSQDRFMKIPPDYRNKYYLFPCICKGDLYKKGDWWKDTILYQIFVDRFYKDGIDKNWYKIPKSKDVFGGTLEGIVKKLDYLTELGINCIYLTPIFESDSNHKYDTVDYYKIDRNFGDEQAFKRFIDECHAKNIKVILDAVFNHTSDNFFAFKDYVKNGSDSKYKDWYCIREDGDYETFADVKKMPKLNTTNPEVIKYFLAVARYWIEEYGIDGWRLDVANEIDHKFWRLFREEVKRVKEDAIIIGEAWDGGESFAEGDQFDSVMNYPFLYIADEYFAKDKISTFEFDGLANGYLAKYKGYIANNLINLLDSHDTSRFLRECGDDIERLKLAVFFQMTYPGLPMIFYGDEAGVTGCNDPDCRRTINFEKMDFELFKYYKKLIEVRKEYELLRSGDYKTVYVDTDIYAYSRYDGNSEIVCLFNKGKKNSDIALKIVGKKAIDIFNDKEYDIDSKGLRVSLKPYGKHIFFIRK